MTFSYNVSDRLKGKLKLLAKKDKPLALRVIKKIKEVVSRNAETIEFYKNLRAPMQDCKRAHIGNFVLTFKVFKEKNFILFDDFDHHDNVYQT
ncbi:addiction module toxin RelE [Candidatus Micrarchaeota archaeon]|nr:addiction module toxin RelE [Candidatus Micrarchaeota archaeon]